MGDAKGKRGLFDWYFKTNLLIRILIGLVVGIVVGLIAGPPIAVVKPLGDLLVRLLLMIVVPVVVFSLIVGSAKITPAKLGRVFIKVIVIYLGTGVLAVLIGLLWGNLLKPGLGFALTGSAPARAAKVPPLVETLLNIVPRNPFDSIVKGEMLPIIFFAVIFGMGLSLLSGSKEGRIRDAAAAVLQICDGVAEVMYKIVGGVLQYAPIGVFALMAIVFGQQGAKAFGPLGMVTLTVYLGLITHLVVVYGGLLSIFGINFLKFLGKAKTPMLTAFVTRSSSGTLPVTLQASEENMGISRGITAFSEPFGATVNMDGTALYQGVCVMFIAFAVGQPLSFGQQMIVVATALLASIGTAGVPGAGAIMLLMVLGSVGFQMTEGSAVAMAYAMILGIDAILDMGRTSLNMTDDLVGTAIAAKTEGELDASKWK